MGVKSTYSRTLWPPAPKFQRHPVRFVPVVSIPGGCTVNCAIFFSRCTRKPSGFWWLRIKFRPCYIWYNLIHVIQVTVKLILLEVLFYERTHFTQSTHILLSVSLSEIFEAMCCDSLKQCVVILALSLHTALGLIVSTFFAFLSFLYLGLHICLLSAMKESWPVVAFKFCTILLQYDLF